MIQEKNFKVIGQVTRGLASLAIKDVVSYVKADRLLKKQYKLQIMQEALEIKYVLNIGDDYKTLTKVKEIREKKLLIEQLRQEKNKLIELERISNIKIDDDLIIRTNVAKQNVKKIERKLKR